MTALARHVEDYLAIRRGLGFKLHNEQRMLADFAAFMDSVDAVQPLWLKVTTLNPVANATTCTPR